MRDFAQVQGRGVISIALAKRALDALEVDAEGLDAMDRRLLGPEHLDYANTLGNWAESLRRGGEPQKAAVMFRDALLIQVKLLRFLQDHVIERIGGRDGGAEGVQALRPLLDPASLGGQGEEGRGGAEENPRGQGVGPGGVYPEGAPKDRIATYAEGRAKDPDGNLIDISTTGWGPVVTVAGPGPVRLTCKCPSIRDTLLPAWI